MPLAVSTFLSCVPCRSGVFPRFVVVRWVRCGFYIGCASSVKPSPARQRAASAMNQILDQPQTLAGDCLEQGMMLPPPHVERGG